MPELPEVQTVVTELQGIVLGKRVAVIEECYPGTVRHFKEGCPQEVKYLPEADYAGIITAVDRRGKYILIELDAPYTLIVHLRMTGKLIYDRNETTVQANHIRGIIRFDDGTRLIFNDPRTFGKIDIVPHNDVCLVFNRLGCEPLTTSFNYLFLKEKFAKSTQPVKKALLNQQIIAGIGNIYACEILYRSKIYPFRKVNTLSDNELKKLVRVTRAVLKQAICCNGTTISDYRRVDDKQGSFQNFLQVYGKQTCPRKHPIIREKTDGRSTYFCPRCQKPDVME